MDKVVRESLAAEQHAIWSHWMKYLFSVGTFNEDGSFTIPEEKVSRWLRQMNTNYIDLPDSERESDRHHADKIFLALGNNQ